MTDLIEGGSGIGRRVRALLTGSGVLAIASTACAAQAQTAPTQETSPAEPAAQSAGTLPEARADVAVGDIVVTANRREESIARVPLAITALGADQLASKGVTSQSDLQIAVPGLTVRSTENQNSFNYSIRGQTVDAFSNSRPAVVTYVNDVQLSAPSVSSLYDLTSVQVLKGPQGTLFGRNTTGGAVIFTTARPSNEFAGAATLRLGNLDLREIQAMINVPIVSDKVLLRLATDIVHRDGYQLNLFNGERLGSQRRQSGRATLLVRPTTQLENTTVFEYNRSGGNNLVPALYSAYGCGATNNGLALATPAGCFYSPALDSIIGVPGAWQSFLAAHPKAPPGGLVAFVDQQRAAGPWTANADSVSRHRARSFYLVNTTTYDLDGDLQLKNIFGFAKSRSRDITDLDGTPYPIEFQLSTAGVLNGSFRDILQYSNELQLLGTALNGDLKYIFGGYYAFERNSVQADNAVFDLTPVFPPPVGINSDYRETDRAKAVFAQGTYSLGSLTGIENLSFTAGIRYSSDTIRFAPLATSSYQGPPEKKTFSDPSWQLGLEYQATPSLLLYALNRGSYRAGGFNGAAPAKFATAAEGGNLFLSETVRDVEAGAKFRGLVLQRPARLTLALYNQWISGIQRVGYFVVQGQLSALTVNIPRAEVRGIEVDGTISPADWLELGVSGTYTDARFTSAGVEIFGSSLTFGPYADTPKFSGSVFADIQLPTPDRLGKMSLRAEVYGQTSQYFTSLNDTFAPQTQLPGYALVNLRYAWSDIAGSQVSLVGFVKNVTKEESFVGGLGQGAALGLNGAVPGEPRTFGVEIGYKF